MKVEMRDISTVKPYEKNPRINDAAVDAVAESLKEFGFRQPLVVDEHGVIVCGHTRWKAAKKLGLATVPVHVARDLTEAQIKAYRLADNKSAELAEWDYDLLPIELGELKADGFDLELLGFDQNELAKLLNPGVKEGLTDPDEVPEPPKEAVTQPGDLWILGEHRLLCGDSTKIEDIERLLDGKKADLVFTDPPYGILYLPENKRLEQLGYLKSDTKNVPEFKKFVRKTTKNIAGILREGGVYYLFMSWEFMGDIVDELRECNCAGHNMLIWDRVKPHFRSYPQDYIPNCEFFLYGWRRGKDRLKNFETGLEHTTIWRIETPAAAEMVHTTEKPVALPQNAIQKSTRKDDLVVDLFGGSGSTMIACERLSRRCCTMELDPLYCDVIVQRFEKFSGKKAQRITVGENAQ